MESVCFELSSRGVGDAAALDERNFAFVVGGVEYRCCRFQACFVSGLVRRLLASDCCLSRVSLKVSDDERHFEDVVSLMNGQQISITPANAAFLEACARELENGELLSRIIDFQLAGDVSMSNVVDRIRIKNEFRGDCKGELDFLASHFVKAELDVLKHLSLSELEQVLTNPQLRLESEDQLYDAIVSLAGENGDEVLALLRHVQCEFLNESKLDEFLDRIFPDLVVTVWGSLCSCLRRFCVSDAKYPLGKTDRCHSLTIEFTGASGAFNGIINHLRNECGGNPHEKGVISITASGTNSHEQCHQLVDYGSGKQWVSSGRPDSFVKFDFKSRRVCLSHYSIKSAESGYQLVRWVLEVSNDGSTWEEVDKRYTTDLVGWHTVRTYECSNRRCRFVRFVRLRQNGKNSGDGDCLNLSEIEFFGQLKDE